jgi:hypothetical protein
MGSLSVLRETARFRKLFGTHAFGVPQLTQFIKDQKTTGANHTEDEKISEG